MLDQWAQLGLSALLGQQAPGATLDQRAQWDLQARKAMLDLRERQEQWAQRGQREALEQLARPGLKAMQVQPDPQARKG